MARQIEEFHPPEEPLPPTQAQLDTVARIIDETNAQRQPPLGTLGVIVPNIYYVARYGQLLNSATPYIGEMFNSKVQFMRNYAGIRHLNGLRGDRCGEYDFGQLPSDQPVFMKECVGRQKIISVITPDGKEHIYPAVGFGKGLDLSDPDDVVDMESQVPLKYCYITIWDNEPIEEVQPPKQHPFFKVDAAKEERKRLLNPEWTEGGRRRKSMKRNRKRTKRTLRRKLRTLIL